MLAGSRGSGEVPPRLSVTASCLVLRAVTDGIPATSEGKIQAALKLEYVDGVGFVSQGLGGEQEETLQTYLLLQGRGGHRLEVAGSPVSQNRQVTTACPE